VVTEDDVRQLALALPGAYEQASYGGRPSWRTAPRMFAWLRDDPEALVVWVEAVEDKEALIAADPVKFFTTAHYEGQPIVLARLEAIDAEEAAELIVDSWLFRAPRSSALEVAIALYSKGVRLGQLDRSEDAIVVYDQVLARFADAPNSRCANWSPARCSTRA